MYSATRRKSCNWCWLQHHSMIQGANYATSEWCFWWHWTKKIWSQIIAGLLIVSDILRRYSWLWGSSSVHMIHVLPDLPACLSVSSKIHKLILLSKKRFTSCIINDQAMAHPHAKHLVIIYCSAWARNRVHWQQTLDQQLPSICMRKMGLKSWTLTWLV